MLHWLDESDNMEHRAEQTDQNVIEKDEWPANSPDLKMLSGADEVTYRDTMTECALPTDLAGAGAFDTATSKKLHEK